jgi:hypothetical protein
MHVLLLNIGYQIYGYDGTVKVPWDRCGCSGTRHKRLMHSSKLLIFKYLLFSCISPGSNAVAPKVAGNGHHHS